MDIPGLSVLGLDVGHHCKSQGRKRAFHVVVLPVDMSMRQHFWCNIALWYYVDGKFHWLHKVAPKGEGKPIVDSAEDGDVMLFEHLDGPFGNVVTVAVQGD